MPKGISAKRPAPKLVVSEQNRSPLYHQLFLILRSKIHSGEYPESSYLPSEHDLASMYRVSRITAVRALNELAAQHLVVREKGRGTRVQFVATATIMRGPQEGVRSSGALSDPQAASIRRPPEEVGKVLNLGLVPASDNVAEVFGLEVGSPILRVERLRHFEKLPFSHLVSFLPESIGGSWTIQDLSNNSVAHLLERGGLHINALNQQITATLSDDDSSARFDIPIGSPLLKIVKIAYARGQKPIEYTISYYPPDRYQYEVAITYKGG